MPLVYVPASQFSVDKVLSRSKVVDYCIITAKRQSFI